MTIEYDPFSHEAMKDPHPLYKRLRAEAPMYYIEKYNAWAISKFQDVWDASLNKNITFTAGQTPGPGSARRTSTSHLYDNGRARDT